MILDHVFNLLFTATKSAGLVAAFLQSDLTNIGKAAEAMSNDNDYITKLRTAKSLADDLVQEIILSSILSMPDASSMIALDAEECTPSATMFFGTELSLIVDPIDGTYEFLNQSDNYSICSAIIQHGVILLTLVYFPARDVLYFIDCAGYSRILSPVKYQTPDNSILLDPPLLTCPPRTVYINSRVPESCVYRLENKGFTVIDDTHGGISCPGAIQECLEGKALAYIAHSRNIRDILMGAILAKSPNGRALDWAGKNLHWLSKGRIPRAIFTRYNLPSELFDCLLSDG